MLRTSACFFSLLGMAFAQTALRPPAVPLVAHDPYFSVWSMADHLTDENTKHWTGTEQPLTSLVRIDGQSFRLMGRDPRGARPLAQQSVEVLPTRTIYAFEGSGVHVTLTFLTPALPQDLDVFSRPLTYIVWSVKSTDGAQHDVSFYFDASAALAVNTADQPVIWSRFHLADGLNAMRIGTREQPILEKDGDNLRIDWGYLYTAASPASQSYEAMGNLGAARNEFTTSGKLTERDDTETTFSPTSRGGQGLAIAIPAGRVGDTPVSRHVLLAYDDIWSMTFLERRLRPYWRRNGATAADLLSNGERDFASLSTRAEALDRDLMADLRKAGGDHFARMAALAYRQSIAAHKLAVDADGSPIYFPKENFSNGCIDTVDVFYPSSPLYALMNPKLLEGSVVPILQYASMPRWPFPFAPHDLGRYPHADGQVYGGRERTEDNQMPVEETSNMLILVSAIEMAEGNTTLAERYWPLLTKWAGYLKEKGLDPENQLSTDDFAGHLAHNANLSIKAIVALGAYAGLAAELGHKSDADAFHTTAVNFAKQWVTMAADGDHYKLAFDKPGTWSQKYNLVWDRVLGLNLFPADVASKEIAFYKKQQNQYGLPLDNRSQYTKLDWIYWTASLTDSQSDFDALIDPTFKFANDSPTRVPLTDWYWTQDAKQRGFQARSVVGGLFMKMLTDPAMWHKWASAKF